MGRNAFYYFMDRTAMNKIASVEEWVEAHKVLFKKEKLYVNIAVVAALAFVILTAAPSIINLQQRSIAQDQQQPQQQQQLQQRNILYPSVFCFF